MRTQNCGLERVVHFPTRNNNTLDIFLTNRPSLINRCEPLLGISDHDIVFIDTDIIAQRQKPTRMKIHLWNKAKLSDLKTEAAAFGESFTSRFTIHGPINTMWEETRISIESLLEKHIPSKMTSTRFNQPWITTTWG